MDEQNDSLTEDIDIVDSEASSKTASGSSWVPIAMGVTGIFLGGAALYLGVYGNNKRSETLLSLDASNQTVSTLSEEVNRLQSELQLSIDKQNATEKQMRTMASQMQAALNQIGNEISSTRKQVSTHTGAIQELSNILQDLKAPPAPVIVENKSPVEVKEDTVAQTEEVEEGNETESKVHVIASGDTLAVLARAYKVNLSELLAANPDVSPTRLQIGQKINIP